MKKFLATVVGVVFVAGMTGGVPAQDKPAETKKAPAHNASGIVKTAAPDSLVVTGKARGGKDAEWTFSVDPKTTRIRKAGKDITPSELAAGDAVHVRYHERGGKNVADAVMVRAPKKDAVAPKGVETKK